MKNFIIAPDSFKGTMDAEQICRIVAGSVRRFVPDSVIHSIPMADGGEGMVSAYVELVGGEKKQLTVCGPESRPVVCEYGVLYDGTAVIEMAGCAGLPLMKHTSNPMRATTYGVGQLLRHVTESGAKNILIGIGGSATNDLGIGMAAALGFRFLDVNGAEVEPFASNFSSISSIEKPKQTLGANIVVACDVDNPLCGPSGATFTFGPQKGIAPDMLHSLDTEMGRMADIIARDIGADVKNLPGAGAAGGLGAALVAFLGAKLSSGVELLLDAAHFDELLVDADMVFTGEGRIDWQSMSGKVPVGVAKRAKAAGVPCVALCGAVGPNAELAYDCGITAIFSSIREVTTFDKIKLDCSENLGFLADSVMRLLLLSERREADDNNNSSSGSPAGEAKPKST